MIQIIAQIGKPMMLKAYRQFQPGQIVKLVRTRNEVYCTLSDSLQPFGMVADFQDSFGNIPVLYNSASIIKTDQFESGDYSIGSLIYSNNFGILTLEKSHANSVPVAYVENDLKQGSLLEIRWI